MAHPKGALIERSKQLGLPQPSFSTRRIGPEHDPTFVSEVVIGAEVYGSGQGSNKRDAEKRASEAALARLEQPGHEFEGPWPIFAEVLAASLKVANSRVDSALTGAEATAEVQRLALSLYKGLLEDLGEIAEVEA